MLIKRRANPNSQHQNRPEEDVLKPRLNTNFLSDFPFEYFIIPFNQHSKKVQNQIKRVQNLRTASQAINLIQLSMLNYLCVADIFGKEVQSALGPIIGVAFLSGNVIFIKGVAEQYPNKKLDKKNIIQFTKDFGEYIGSICIVAFSASVSLCLAGQVFSTKSPWGLLGINLFVVSNYFYAHNQTGKLGKIILNETDENLKILLSRYHYGLLENTKAIVYIKDPRYDHSHFNASKAKILFHTLLMQTPLLRTKFKLGEVPEIEKQSISEELQIKAKRLKPAPL